MHTHGALYKGTRGRGGSTGLQRTRRSGTIPGLRGLGCVCAPSLKGLAGLSDSVPTGPVANIPTWAQYAASRGVSTYDTNSQAAADYLTMGDNAYLNSRSTPGSASGTPIQITPVSGNQIVPLTNPNAVALTSNGLVGPVTTQVVVANPTPGSDTALDPLSSYIAGQLQTAALPIQEPPPVTRTNMIFMLLLAGVIITNVL